LVLGAVRKRRPQYGQGGSLDVDVCIFLCKKFRIFLNLWCVRTDKEEFCRHFAVLRTFCRQGGGSQFFAILCWRLLWTAPCS